jgi:hypothetical protein
VYRTPGRRLQAPEVPGQNHSVPGFARVSRGSPVGYERRYRKPCVNTAVRRSVPLAVASVALSAS